MIGSDGGTSRDLETMGGFEGQRVVGILFSGLLSLALFLAKLSPHIGLTLQLPELDDLIQPNAVSNVFAKATSLRGNDSEEYSTALEIYLACENLSKGREEYLLRLFSKAIVVQHQL